MDSLSKYIKNETANSGFVNPYAYTSDCKADTNCESDSIVSKSCSGIGDYSFAISSGFSLIELMLVLALLGIVATMGFISFSHGLKRQEARGAAQVWQAAAGRTQVGVMWRGGSAQLLCAEGSLSLTHDASLFGIPNFAEIPDVPLDVNVARWRDGGGTLVSFSGALASPSSGGSIFFIVPGGSYRVTIRPETGFTVRSWSPD